VSGWTTYRVPNGGAGVAFARVAIGALEPRGAHPMELIVDGQRRAQAIATTLPQDLPGLDDPLRLMLGSCFCAAEDAGGSVGKTFASLPPGLRPELKFLCGDQVYLDSPFYRFVVLHTKEDLARTFLKNYIDTWTQSGDLQGFRQVLSNGAAWLTSDDHEFWNNAPYPSFSVNTWTEAGRNDWHDIAANLFSAFQMSAAPVREFAIGPLNVFVADTRINRSRDRSTFLDAADMQALGSWIQNLSFPGLLIIGQPIFERRSGILGELADWNLPDFAQYEVLSPMLLDTPQSIIVLTGDVHYGRVSRTITHRGAEIVEIIASPMSLVTGGGKPSWHAPPERFPSTPVPGVGSIPVETVNTWQRATNHFLVIELWQAGGGLGLRARTCETAPDGQTPTTPVYERTFRRMM
jgi:hypothetical protein